MALRAEDVYVILKQKMDSGGATPEQIQSAVDKYLDEHPAPSPDLILNGTTLELKEGEN